MIAHVQMPCWWKSQKDTANVEVDGNPSGAENIKYETIPIVKHIVQKANLI